MSAALVYPELPPIEAALPFVSDVIQTAISSTVRLDFPGRVLAEVLANEAGAAVIVWRGGQRVRSTTHVNAFGRDRDEAARMAVAAVRDLVREWGSP